MKAFDAISYKDLKGDFNNEDEDLLVSLLKENNIKGRVLDIGCGDGLLTGRVQNMFPEYEIVGIDNSSEQIALAQSKNGHISFELSDVIGYNPEEKFDSVYSFYAFPHIPKSKLGQALASVRNLLKQDGIFYLFTNICLFDTSVASKEEQEACDIVFLNNWTSQINLVSMQEMQELFKQNGLVEVENQKLRTGAKIKDYGEMISWVFVLK